MDWRYLTLLPCLGLINACVGPVAIDASDSVEFNDFSVSIPVNDDSARLRARATRTNGSFDQHLEAGERIGIDNSSIVGPAEVGGDLELDYYSLALGFETTDNTSAPTPLRVGYYLGIAQTEFDLALQSGGNDFAARDGTTELYVQLLLAAPVAKNLDLGFSWAFSLGRDLSGISEFDLGVEYRLLRNLTLAAGYRWFHYQYGLGEDESNLEVDFHGPHLGVYFPF